MSKPLIVADQGYGYIYCKRGLLATLREEFFVYRKGSYFSNFPRIYFITPKGRFLVGLYHEIIKFLKENDIEYEFLDKRRKFKVSKTNVLKRLDEFNLSLREEYQLPGLLKALKYPYCGFSWPTASGKGVFISALVASYGLPTLVLIHTKELMYQLGSNISEHLNTEVGYIGDGKNNPKKITIGIVASLKDKKYNKFLSTVEHLICDEYHHEAARTWVNVVLRCKDVFIKNGFSATPFREDNKSFYLQGLTGPIIQRISTSQMIKWGFLSRPYIDIANISKDNIDNLTYASAYKRGIVESKERNNFACKWVLERYRNDDQVIVFVDRIEHGNTFKRLLLKNDVNYRDVDFMNGKEKMTLRRNALKSFRDKKTKILIGTKIYNEGVDLPATNAGVNLGGGGGRIPTIQKLGRLLRKSKMDGIDVYRGEEIVRYLDFYDSSSKYLRKHSRARIKVYEKEKEYKVTKIS